MVKLVFLGTGGGRFVTATQQRATGGIFLEMDNINFCIDPGPGALVRAAENGVDLRRTDVVLVSHVHIDHSNDANAVIDAMTEGAKNPRGVLIGSESAIKGVGTDSPAILRIYLKSLEKVVVLKPGEEIQLAKVSVKATQTKHSDPTCVGFVIKGSKQISYLSDGEYFEGLAEPHKGADIAIMNTLRPYDDKWKLHLDTKDAVKLTKEINPGLVVLQHFGFKMLEAGPAREAARAEKESGVRTIAAEDGMVIDLDKGKSPSLEKFVTKQRFK